MQKHKNKQGFTLIEILIVMLIISIVGSIAVLTISKNKTTEIKNTANQLAYLFQFAADEASLQPKVIGVTVNDNEIKFYEFKHDTETNKDAWTPTSDTLLTNIELPSGISVKLKEEDDDVPPSDTIQPQIIFSTAGEVNPFTLLLGKNDQSPLYKITGGADGTLHEIKL